MRLDLDVLSVLGEMAKSVQTILKAHQLSAVSIVDQNEQRCLQVITPYPLDYQRLNEAQNSIRQTTNLPVCLESINPNHPIARFPIEVATSSAFHLLIARTLYRHRLFRPRFGGPPDQLTITASVGEPFEWSRINEAQNELRNFATFEIFIEPRDLNALI